MKTEQKRRLYGEYICGEFTQKTIGRSEMNGYSVYGNGASMASVNMNLNLHTHYFAFKLI